HDRNVQPVGDACELPDLIFLQELRLVHKDAMDGGVLMSLGDAGIKVVALSEYLGLGFQADARGDQPVISAAVVASDEEQSVQPARTIIVACLQEQRRRGGVHGGLVERELGPSAS